MAKKTARANKSKRKVASVPAATKTKPKTAEKSQNRKAAQGVAPVDPPVARAKQTPPAPKSAPSTLSAVARNLPAEAALSFLRDTKGLVSWSLRDLSQTLNISREESEHVVALLQLQGYVQPEAHKAGEWMTTPSGETVSGAKAPRFDRATVEATFASLKQRIEESNKDRSAKFEITRAVAFGDFLAKDRARVQAADVGVELVRKDRQRTPDEIAVAHSAVEAREERTFVRQLRGRSSLINLKMYADWMGKRTHQKLF
jgi:hypothetical protein